MTMQTDAAPRRRWRVSDLTVPGRCLVMGIVNVTADSFSDGGEYLDTERAIAHAHRLLDEGADMIDVGGESTRPGAVRVPPEVEAARVVPVIEALAGEGIPTSVDTMRAATARAAAEAGVAMINDVSAGLADPDMLPVAAEADLPLCLMHWRTSNFGDASGRADYDAVGGVVEDVRGLLGRQADRAIAAGVAPENIVLDPGLGFAKAVDDNWALLRALPGLLAEGYPVLVAASRKRFLSDVRARRGMSHTPREADPATAAVTALSARLGAWGVRVHDVAASRDAVDVAASWALGHAPEAAPAAGKGA